MRTVGAFRIILSAGTWLWVPVIGIQLWILLTGGGASVFALFLGAALGLLWCRQWPPRLREIRGLWQGVPADARLAVFKVWAFWPVLLGRLEPDRDPYRWPKIQEIAPAATGFDVGLAVFDDDVVKTLVNRSGELARMLNVDFVDFAPHGAGVLRMRVKTGDHLATLIPPGFWERYPAAKLPTSPLPVAVTETGEVLTVGLAHTLVIGATGSGKGSVLWAYVRSLLSSKNSGLVEFAGIDPKRTELKGCEALFGLGLAYTPDEILPLLEGLVAKMRERQASGGRRFEPTVDQPMLLLVIDEFAAMTIGAAKDVKSRIDGAFFALMTQGRSAGIAVLALAQQPQKEVLGNLRSQFVLRIALRTENRVETDMVLGEGAADDGARCHDLPVATAGNGYRTAGLGWARTDTGQLGRVRFPYTSDDEIETILEGVSDERAALG